MGPKRDGLTYDFLDELEEGFGNEDINNSDAIIGRPLDANDAILRAGGIGANNYLENQYRILQM